MHPDPTPPRGAAGSSREPTSAQAADWLAGGGALGELIRATDWSRTPLGARERWPQSLRTTASIVVESKLPMALLWGDELHVMYNDAFATIIAGRHPHALGHPAREMWPELWHFSESRLSAVLHRGEAGFYEELRFMLERHGRTEAAFFTVAETPVRIEDGSIGGVLLALQETTAASVRARLLRESEARFRAVVESSRDGINLLDLGAGKYVFMSPAQVALTGFTAEELDNLPVEAALARVHPDDRPRSLEQQRQIAAGEEPGGEPLEYRWMAKSGEYRWFSDSRGLVRDAEGHPVALVGICRDVTERKRMEDALRAGQQMYAAIFERSPIALALSTLSDGTLAAVNDAFLELFALARDEAIGKRGVDLGVIAPDIREQVRAALVADGQLHDFEYVGRTKSGEPRHLSLDTQLVDIGGVSHLLSAVQDITARKEVEVARQLARQTQELGELRTRFFSSISHELRTPLALILGPIEHLLQAPGTLETTRRDLIVVQRNARTLLGLVDNLLDLARLEAGRMAAAYTEADLAELVRLAASHFEVLREEQRIAFTVEAPPRLPAQLDPEQILRVLLNLLSNAFKLTPSSGRIRLTLREAPGGARLEVADSGPGIPAERRASVFERFGPVQGSAHHRPGGTGLGLAIARELVERHGGAISIADAPEGGTLFAVDLPLTAPSGTTVRPAVGAAPAWPQVVPPLERAAGAPPPPAGDGPLVLVVEDHLEMSRFIARSLSDRYRVAVAFDGAEGLAQAVALRPELILCDLMLPALDGEQLVREARRRRELDATPIVVLSARADCEARVRLLREGAQDYLAKPISVEELRARVGNLVARKLAEQATRRAEAKYRGIIETAADAIIAIDERHQITEWNRGAEGMFGYSRDQALGMPLACLLPERHHATHHEHVARFIAGPELARRMEHAVTVGVRRSGEVFPISATISNLELDGARIATVIVRDTSEEKRAEEVQRVLAEVGRALASLEYDAPLRELARVVAGSLGDYVVIFTADEGGALSCAAAASRDPAWAWIADLLMTKQAAPGPGHPVSQVFAERSPRVQDLEPALYEAIALSPEHLRALRATRPRCMMLVPLAGTQRCVGVLGLISAEHRFDARELGLAQEVARRCAVFIENAGLHHAERRATQARDEMLGVVAHDLRSPLSSILLCAAVLEKTASSAQSVRQTQTIERSAARMIRIIEDLLDVAQLEMGELKVVRARVSAADLVTEVVALHGAQAAARSIELRLDTAEGLPPVWADRDRVLQVFENLIGNALKFTQHGSISVGARPRGAELLFWVADTGPGIATDELPHVFDRFWKARRSDHRGTAGLGLAIVKGLIEAQGGRVWVESEHGAGATFFFTLPAAGDPEP